MSMDWRIRIWMFSLVRARAEFHTIQPPHSLSPPCPRGAAQSRGLKARVHRAGGSTSVLAALRNGALRGPWAGGQAQVGEPSGGAAAPGIRPPRRRGSGPPVGFAGPGLRTAPLTISADPPADPIPLDLRDLMVSAARRMNAAGINQGTSGNLSLRAPGGFLVTPTSLPYERMEAQDLVALDFDGRPLTGAPAAQRRPSSEWRLHADVLSQRPEVEAVVHCHSIRATALACHGRGIPSFHYMVAVAGGPDIRCAPYALFGTPALSRLAVRALDGRLACLLAHHGQVALGRSLDQALRIAIEVETLATMYLEACRLGEPPLLAAVEMERVLEQMGALLYG